ncbi:hypothetical protein GCM10018791_15310 [Streptomyces zaomyceticus]|nr:hypothetical protein GCM10018791_15310 [Streptomyces zaomyceticus]
MTPSYFQVDVPMKNTAAPERRGTHVFTGTADDDAQALRRAHEMYEAARRARAAGRPLPRRRPEGWGGHAAYARDGNRTGRPPSSRSGSGTTSRCGDDPLRVDGLGPEPRPARFRAQATYVLSTR